MIRLGKRRDANHSQNDDFNFMPGRTERHLVVLAIQSERGREVENAKKVEGADGPLERAHR